MLIEPDSQRVGRRERRLLRRLVAAGAVMPERAHPLPALGRSSVAWLERLQALGLLHPVPGERYYVDLQAYARQRRAWVARSLITTLVCLILITGVALLWRRFGAE
jgi:hypothetical protein